MYEWETRDGRRIPINKLETNHLLNIINMLEGAKERALDYMEMETEFMGIPNINTMEVYRLIIRWKRIMEKEWQRREGIFALQNNNVIHP